MNKKIKEKIADTISYMFLRTDKIITYPISKLKIDQNRKGVYTQEDDKVQVLSINMRENGFDKSQPIIVSPDKTIIDGHSRYLAAKKIGLKNVPVIIKNITNENDVLIYMEHLQLNRRNLTDAEKLEHYDNLMHLKEKAKAEGKPILNFSDEAVAKLLNNSPRQIQKMHEVKKKATTEQLSSLKDGTKSLNQIYNEIKSSANVKEKSEKLQYEKIEKKSLTSVIDLSDSTLNLLREIANEYERWHNSNFAEEIRKDAFNKMNRNSHEVCKELCKQLGFISQNE